MYTLVTAMLVKKEKPTGFEEVDVSNMSINSLIGLHRFGYLVLTNNHIPGELFLTLETLERTDLGLINYETTVKRWLENNGDKLLPHILVEPEYIFSKVNYADLNQAGFNRTAVHPRSTIEGYPVSSLTDLYVRKDGVDSDILSNNSVFVVNGYLHNHDKYKSGAKIVDAVTTIMDSGKSQVGVISFLNAGGIKTLDIKTEMLLSHNPDLGLVNEMILKLGVDLRKKGLMLSIAGMLLHSQDVFKVINPEFGIISVNLSMLDWITRVQLVVRSLAIPHLAYDDLNLPIDVMFSNPFILSLLRMSQTFAIVTEQPFSIVKKEPVFYQGVYGRYFSHEYNYDIMLDNYGRIVPYFYYGSQELPWTVDKHVYFIPIEFMEYKKNVARRHYWRQRSHVVNQSTTNHTSAMGCDWLKIDFIKPV